MHPFCLDLADGSRVSGLSSSANAGGNSPFSKGIAVNPLLVCLHGGSYDSTYFDSTPELSVESVTSLFNIPIVSLDRPNYGQTTPIGQLAPGETFIQESAKRLHNSILPAIWSKFGSGANGIVLWGHSVGAATSIAIAGLHGQSQSQSKEAHTYPLSGLICSGLGSTLKTDIPELAEGMKHITPEGVWPADIRSKGQLKPQLGLCSEEAFKASLAVNPPPPSAEVEDIAQLFFQWRYRQSKEVRVPVLYGLPEHDLFWPIKSLENSEDPNSRMIDRLEEFAGAFEKSPAVSRGVVLRAPHALEMSIQARAWAARCCGFALECAVASEVKPDATA